MSLTAPSPSSPSPLPSSSSSSFSTPTPTPTTTSSSSHKHKRQISSSPILDPSDLNQLPVGDAQHSRAGSRTKLDHHPSIEPEEDAMLFSHHRHSSVATAPAVVGRRSTQGDELMTRSDAALELKWGQQSNGMTIPVVEDTQEPNGGLQINVEATAQPLWVTHEQTQKLASMPTELSSMLSRLSSQHHLSEYNTLKRVLLNPTSPVPATQPLPLPQSLPLPRPSAPAIQRSLSTPTAHISLPTPTISTTSSSPPARSVSPKAPSASPVLQHLFRPSTPSSSDLRKGTQSLPLSRATSPPPLPFPSTPTSNSTTPPATSLTPTLIGFAFSPESSGASHTVVDALHEAIQSDLMAASRVQQQQQVEREELEAQIKSEVRTVEVAGAGGVETRDVTVVTGSMVNGTTLLPGMRIMNGIAVKTSVSHPMNISPILPPDILPIFSSLIFSHKSHSSSFKPRSPLTPSSSLTTNHTPTPPFTLDTPSSCNLWTLISPTCSPTPLTENSVPHLLTLNPENGMGGGGVHGAKQIGNFFLSSCPGKKVRLEGGNRGGRNPICRDLKLDLERMKMEGVRVVICCLDDQELSFLGAPWEEYERTASALSLSVVRIPMVEGFAPSSPAALDAHLTRIVKYHTLRGESVLAHCRGGIGRAGAIACCWLIKCGFVGQLGIGEDGVEEVPTLKIVERVIETIRKRRSVKSIETAQQVHFLVEYVEYLKEQAIALPAIDVV